MFQANAESNLKISHKQNKTGSKFSKHIFQVIKEVIWEYPSFDSNQWSHVKQEYYGLTQMHGQGHSCDPLQFWERLTKPISSIPLFPNVSEPSKHLLRTEYYVHIWQVSAPLSCSGTCQIWMWFKESNRYFCNNNYVPNGEINERSSKPPSCSLGAVTLCLWWYSLRSKIERQNISIFLSPLQQLLVKHRIRHGQSAAEYRQTWWAWGQPGGSTLAHKPGHQQYHNHGD